MPGDSERKTAEETHAEITELKQRNQAIQAAHDVAQHAWEIPHKHSKLITSVTQCIHYGATLAEYCQRENYLSDAAVLAAFRVAYETGINHGIAGLLASPLAPVTLSALEISAYYLDPVNADAFKHYNLPPSLAEKISTGTASFHDLMGAASICQANYFHAMRQCLSIGKSSAEIKDAVFAPAERAIRFLCQMSRESLAQICHTCSDPRQNFLGPVGYKFLATTYFLLNLPTQGWMDILENINHRVVHETAELRQQLAWLENKFMSNELSAQERRLLLDEIDSVTTQLAGRQVVESIIAIDKALEGLFLEGGFEKNRGYLESAEVAATDLQPLPAAPSIPPMTMEKIAIPDFQLSDIQFQYLEFQTVFQQIAGHFFISAKPNEIRVGVNLIGSSPEQSRPYVGHGPHPFPNNPTGNSPDTRDNVLYYIVGDKETVEYVRRAQAADFIDPVRDFYADLNDVFHNEQSDRNGEDFIRGISRLYENGDELYQAALKRKPWLHTEKNDWLKQIFGLDDPYALIRALKVLKGIEPKFYDLDPTGMRFVIWRNELSLAEKLSQSDTDGKLSRGFIKELIKFDLRLSATTDLAERQEIATEADQFLRQHASEFQDNDAANSFWAHIKAKKIISLDELYQKFSEDPDISNAYLQQFNYIVSHMIADINNEEITVTDNDAVYKATMFASELAEKTSDHATQANAAQLNCMQGHFIKAEQYLEKALAATPDDVGLLQLKALNDNAANSDVYNELLAKLAQEKKFTPEDVNAWAESALNQLRHFSNEDSENALDIAQKTLNALNKLGAENEARITTYCNILSITDLDHAETLIKNGVVSEDYHSALLEHYRWLLGQRLSMSEIKTHLANMVEETGEGQLKLYLAEAYFDDGNLQYASRQLAESPDGQEKEALSQAIHTDMLKTGIRIGLDLVKSAYAFTESYYQSDTKRNQQRLHGTLNLFYAACEAGIAELSMLSQYHRAELALLRNPDNAQLKDTATQLSSLEGRWFRGDVAHLSSVVRIAGLTLEGAGHLANQETFVAIGRMMTSGASGVQFFLSAEKNWLSLEPFHLMSMGLVFLDSGMKLTGLDHNQLSDVIHAANKALGENYLLTGYGLYHVADSFVVAFFDESLLSMIMDKTTIAAWAPCALPVLILEAGQLSFNTYYNYQAIQIGKGLQRFQQLQDAGNYRAAFSHYMSEIRGNLDTRAFGKLSNADGLKKELQQYERTQKVGLLGENQVDSNGNFRGKPILSIDADDMEAMRPLQQNFQPDDHQSHMDYFSAQLARTPRLAEVAFQYEIARNQEIVRRMNAVYVPLTFLLYLDVFYRDAFVAALPFNETTNLRIVKTGFNIINFSQDYSYAHFYNQMSFDALRRLQSAPYELHQAHEPREILALFSWQGIRNTLQSGHAVIVISRNVIAFFEPFDEHNESPPLNAAVFFLDGAYIVSSFVFSGVHFVSIVGNALLGAQIYSRDFPRIIAFANQTFANQTFFPFEPNGSFYNTAKLPRQAVYDCGPGFERYRNLGFTDITFVLLQQYVPSLIFYLASTSGVGAAIAVAVKAIYPTLIKQRIDTAESAVKLAEEELDKAKKATQGWWNWIRSGFSSTSFKKEKESSIKEAEGTLQKAKENFRKVIPRFAQEKVKEKFDSIIFFVSLALMIGFFILIATLLYDFYDLWWVQGRIVETINKFQSLARKKGTQWQAIEPQLVKRCQPRIAWDVQRWPGYLASFSLNTTEKNEQIKRLNTECERTLKKLARLIKKASASSAQKNEQEETTLPENVSQQTSPATRSGGSDTAIIYQLWMLFAYIPLLLKNILFESYIAEKDDTANFSSVNQTGTVELSQLVVYQENTGPQNIPIICDVVWEPPGEDKATGQPTFPYHANCSDGREGSITFFAHPFPCRSTAGDRHNVISATGEFEHQVANLTPETIQRMPEECTAVPLTLEEQIFQGAEQGAIHGLLRGFNQTASLFLQTKGYSKFQAQLGGKACYYLSYFTHRYLEHTQFSITPQESIEAVCTALGETGQLAIVDGVISGMRGVCDQISDRAAEAKWHKVSWCTQKVATLLQFGIFAYRAREQDISVTAANVVVGTMTQKAVEVRNRQIFNMSYSNNC